MPDDKPILVFSTEDIPDICRRCGLQHLRPVYHRVLRQADALTEPASPWCVDPQTVFQRCERTARLPMTCIGGRLRNLCETLGFAWRMTGKRRYADVATGALMAAAQRFSGEDCLATKYPPGGWGLLMSAAALGLDWAGDAMSTDDRAFVAQRGADWVRWAVEQARSNAWWIPYHNFIGVILGGAGTLALRIREDFPEEAEEWLATITDVTRRWLDISFDADGGYLEGINYVFYGLENGTLFQWALRRNGGEDLMAHPHLRRVSHFLAMSLLPGDTVFDARNDSDYVHARNPFLPAHATANNDGLAAWLWRKTAVPDISTALGLCWETCVPPSPPDLAGEPLYEHFEGRGLVISRTGWARGDAMLSIEAGPYRAITHNQADKGHVNFYSLGARWAIDSGYGNKRDDPEGRDSSFAHSVVLIDGQGQAPCGAGLGSNGKVLVAEHSDVTDTVLCDQTEAYNTNNRGTPGATVEFARRHALFVRPTRTTPAYVALFDDIRKDDSEHAFTWTLHTDAQNTVDLCGPTPLISAPAESPEEAMTREWHVEAPSSGTYALWAYGQATRLTMRDLLPRSVTVDGSSSALCEFAEGRHADWQQANTPTGEPLLLDLEAGPHTLRIESLSRPLAEAQRIAIALPDAQPPFDDACGQCTLAGPRMRVHLHAAAAPSWTLGVFERHPVLKATVRAVEPVFAALLLPIPAGAPEPAVTTARDADGMIITLSWPNTTHTILWPASRDGRPTIHIRTEAT